MKFRKKPVVIDAIQYTFGGLTKSFPKEFQDAVCDKPHNGIHGGLHIDTLEGCMDVSYGDWVIKGVNGEFYPCKPDIFEKTYEEVN